MKITFAIDEQTHKQFKAVCANEGNSMRVAIVKAIKDYMEQGKQNEQSNEAKNDKVHSGIHRTWERN